jgi:hypothetical protein
VTARRSQSELEPPRWDGRRKKRKSVRREFFENGIERHQTDLQLGKHAIEGRARSAGNGKNNPLRPPAQVRQVHFDAVFSVVAVRSWGRRSNSRRRRRGSGGGERLIAVRWRWSFPQQRQRILRTVHGCGSCPFQGFQGYLASLCRGRGACGVLRGRPLVRHGQLRLLIIDYFKWMWEVLFRGLQ